MAEELDEKELESVANGGEGLSSQGGGGTDGMYSETDLERIANGGDPTPSTDMGDFSETDLERIASMEPEPARRSADETYGKVNANVIPGQSELAAKGKRGGVESAALNIQADTGIDADYDGSWWSGIKNGFKSFSHAVFGKPITGQMNSNLQALARGTYTGVGGKEIPLEQLPDSTLDYVMNNTGANGFARTVMPFLGRGDIMRQWDETEGIRYEDEAERKRARVEYAKELARGMIGLREESKMAADQELAAREETVLGSMGRGLVEQGGYTGRFMIGPYGAVAGLLEAADRFGELTADKTKVDKDGSIVVDAKRDTVGTAAAKSAARGVVAPLVELVGGKLLVAGAKSAIGSTIGRIPLVKQTGEKIASTAVGKAVGTFARKMDYVGRMTGMGSFPEEMVEEWEDQVLDAAIGLDRRASENKGTTALGRALESNSEFFTAKNMKELASSMVLMQVLQGGAAHAIDRHNSRRVDGILEHVCGIDGDKIKNWTANQKQEAFTAWVNGLSEAEVKNMVDGGSSALNRFMSEMFGGHGIAPVGKLGVVQLKRGGATAEEVNEVLGEMNANVGANDFIERDDEGNAVQRSFNVPMAAGPDGKQSPFWQTTEDEAGNRVERLVDNDNQTVIDRYVFPGDDAPSFRVQDSRGRQRAADSFEEALAKANEMIADKSVRDAKLKYIAGLANGVLRNQRVFVGDTMADVKRDVDADLGAGAFSRMWNSGEGAYEESETENGVQAASFEMPETDANGNSTLVPETDEQGNLVYETDDSGKPIVGEDGRPVQKMRRQRAVFFSLDKIGSIAEMHAAAVHEVARHSGLANMFTPEAKADFLKRLDASSFEVADRDSFERMLDAEMDHFGIGSKEELWSNQDAVEEIFALATENMVSSPTLKNRLFSAARGWFRNRYKHDLKLSPDEVAMVVDQMNRDARSGRFNGNGRGSYQAREGRQMEGDVANFRALRGIRRNSENAPLALPFNPMGAINQNPQNAPKALPAPAMRMPDNFTGKGPDEWKKAANPGRAFRDMAEGARPLTDEERRQGEERQAKKEEEKTFAELKEEEELLAAALPGETKSHRRMQKEAERRAGNRERELERTIEEGRKRAEKIEKTAQKVQLEEGKKKTLAKEAADEAEDERRIEEANELKQRAVDQAAMENAADAAHANEGVARVAEKQGMPDYDEWLGGRRDSAVMRYVYNRMLDEAAWSAIAGNAPRTPQDAPAPQTNNEPSGTNGAQDGARNEGNTNDGVESGGIPPATQDGTVLSRVVSALKNRDKEAGVKAEEELRKEINDGKIPSDEEIDALTVGMSDEARNAIRRFIHGQIAFSKNEKAFAGWLMSYKGKNAAKATAKDRAEFFDFPMAVGGCVKALANRHGVPNAIERLNAAFNALIKDSKRARGWRWSFTADNGEKVKFNLEDQLVRLEKRNKLYGPDGTMTIAPFRSLVDSVSQSSSSVAKDRVANIIRDMADSEWPAHRIMYRAANAERYAHLAKTHRTNAIRNFNKKYFQEQEALDRYAETFPASHVASWLGASMFVPGREDAAEIRDWWDSNVGFGKRMNKDVARFLAGFDLKEGVNDGSDIFAVIGRADLEDGESGMIDNVKFTQFLDELLADRDKALEWAKSSDTQPGPMPTKEDLDELEEIEALEEIGADVERMRKSLAESEEEEWSASFGEIMGGDGDFVTGEYFLPLNASRLAQAKRGDFVRLGANEEPMLILSVDAGNGIFEVEGADGEMQRLKVTDDGVGPVPTAPTAPTPATPTRAELEAEYIAATSAADPSDAESMERFNRASKALEEWDAAHSSQQDESSSAPSPIARTAESEEEAEGESAEPSPASSAPHAFKRGERVFLNGEDSSSKRISFVRKNGDGTATVQIVTPGANRYMPSKTETRDVPMGDVRPTGMRFRISNLYTGSAADYANRDEDGNIVNPPSLVHVGTGEGSQVYGWGLYASSERGVAETYVGRYNQARNLLYKGKEIDVGSMVFPRNATPEELALKFGRSTGSVKGAISAMEYEAGKDRTYAKKFREAISWMKNHKDDFKENEHVPTLYEQTFFTNRAPGDESHLLKWYEKPTPQQKKWIGDQLVKEGYTADDWPIPDYMKFPGMKPIDAMLAYCKMSAHKGKGNYDNQDVYDALPPRGNPKGKSEFLARADIDGIKYPVDSYGGKTVKDGDKAGWNYVSFRDDNIRVDHKWVDGEMKFRRAVTPAEDAAYMDAVKRGDMETAARMVREAAAKAMPDTKVVGEDGLPLVVWHGASKKFTVFDTYNSHLGPDRLPQHSLNPLSTYGWFTDKKSYAQVFATANLVSSFVDIKTPFYIERSDVDAESLEKAKNHLESLKEQRRKIGLSNAERSKIGKRIIVANETVRRIESEGTTYGKLKSEAEKATALRRSRGLSDWKSEGANLRETLREEGFDGVIIIDTEIDGDLGGKGAKNFYIPFGDHPSQIKSADPVTYDDAGNVIPLSQRFNPQNNDIRFRRALTNRTGNAIISVDETDNGKISLSFRRGNTEAGEGAGGNLQAERGLADSSPSVTINFGEEYGADFAGKLYRGFKSLSDDSISDIAEKVFEAAGKLGVKYKFVSFSDSDWQEAGIKDARGNYAAGVEGGGGIVAINTDYLTGRGLKTSPGFNADTILHETIHGITTYAVDAVRRNDIAGFRSKAVGRELEAAVRDLDELYQIAKQNADIARFNVTNPKELIASLSDAEFRDELKKVDADGGNLLRHVAEAIKRIVGFVFKKHNVETASLANLYKFIDNMDSDLFMQMRDRSIATNPFMRDVFGEDGDIRFRRTYSPDPTLRLLADALGLSPSERVALNNTAGMLGVGMANTDSMPQADRDLVDAVSGEEGIAAAYDTTRNLVKVLFGKDAGDKWNAIKRGLVRRLTNYLEPVVNMQRLVEKRTLLRVKTSDSVADAAKFAFSHQTRMWEDAQREILNPLYKEIADNKLNADARAIGGGTVLHELLLALHGPAFNRMIAERTKGKKLDGSGASTAFWLEVLRGHGASGTDEQLLSALERGDYSGLGWSADSVGEKAANAVQLVRDLTNRTRDILEKSGRLSSAQRATWESLSPFYVPMRFDQDAGDNFMKVWLYGGTVEGNGYARNYTGPESKHAFGHRNIADNPLVFAIQQLSTAIQRATDNDVRRKLADMVRRNPFLGEVIDPNDPAQRLRLPASNVLGPNTTAYTTVTINALESHDNIVAFKEDGNTKFIVLGQRPASGNGVDNDALSEAEAKLVGRAVKKTSLAQVGPTLKFIRGLTRTFGMLRTTFSPEFLVSNFLADSLQAGGNLYATFGAKGIAQFKKNVGKAIASARRMQNGELNPARHTMDRYAQELRENGGLIGGLATANFADIEADIAREVAKFAGDRKAKAIDFVVHLAEKMNGPVEQATRLAAFAVCRQNGMSVADAAKYAREVTVDFNQKGEWTPILNSLFAFSNASLVDMERSFGAFVAKRGLRLAFGLTSLGFLASMFGFWQDDPDDEREGDVQWKDTKDYVKQNKLGVRVGPMFLSVPIRGINRVLYYAGHKLFEVVSGNDSIADAAMSVGGFAAANMLDPIGDATKPLQAATPSVFRPMTELAQNESFSGTQIYREPMSKRTDVRSEMGRGTTPGVWIAVAKALNSITGGNRNKRGVLDVQPEIYQHIYSWLTGSAGNDIARVVNLVSDIATLDFSDLNLADDIGNLRNIPGIRRFASGLQPNTATFQDKRGEFAEDIAQFNDVAKEDPAVMSELRSRHPYFGDAPSAKAWRQELQDLIKAHKVLMKAEMSTTGEERSSIHQMRMQVQAAFIRRVDKAPSSDETKNRQLVTSLMRNADKVKKQNKSREKHR